ncbi:dihydroxyacetone kinase phosphoryl donor subunit DhaM [Agromyces badenianii]|uniref:dihydroxyacetone kinase phosphoryl donor subunit DhaM n=1 Tax=Agromyces badenianii TaxID=2080742 RepID=UPI001F40BD68|nr:dihydroxyacetone kinase phosphoryl donor subunit DhaM [Agromyces badenianii]
MSTPGKVGLVFVSHSAGIADGLVALARQMAPTATLVAAGGTDDGRIGTSFDLVTAGIAEADAGAGVAVLCDLGSAILTAETALDFLDEKARARVRIVDAPLVEGGVAAAVAAESGESLEQVVAAARSAWNRASEDASASGGPDAAGDSEPTGGAETRAADTAAGAGHAASGYSRSIRLVNADGLHARPAAELVKLAGTFPQKVTINGTDAKSLLGIMSLGLTKGAPVDIASDDAEGRAAVDAIAELAESGFGEA